MVDATGPKAQDRVKGGRGDVEIVLTRGFVISDGGGI